MWRFRRAAALPDLSEDALRLRALRHIRLIAAAGLMLILIDLVLSLAAPAVKIVEKDGGLYLVRPDAGKSSAHIRLHAEVSSGGESYSEDLDLRLDPKARPDQDPEAASGDTSVGSSGDPAGASGDAKAGGPSPQDLVRSEFRMISSEINEDPAASLVPLPMQLSGGERIHWRRAHSNSALPLAFLTGLASVIVFRSRFQPLRRLEQRRRSSVRQQLPVFLNELVLLLNAGLVLTRAFELTVQQSAAGGDYFLENLQRIRQSVRNTNASVHEELQSFAKECGVTELIRVSNVISDNINKGAELCRKLERESEQLWHSRKVQAELRGRIAETKMTLPLAIFLCVLILITVSPALLQL